MTFCTGGALDAAGREFLGSDERVVLWKPVEAVALESAIDRTIDRASDST